MELRLQKARNLLMQTDMSVINVALACGFASPSHFSNAIAHTTRKPHTENVEVMFFSKVNEFGKPFPK